MKQRSETKSRSGVRNGKSLRNHCKKIKVRTWGGRSLLVCNTENRSFLLLPVSSYLPDLLKVPLTMLRLPFLFPLPLYSVFCEHPEPCLTKTAVGSGFFTARRAGKQLILKPPYCSSNTVYIHNEQKELAVSAGQILKELNPLHWQKY